jgi:predicted nucleic acid-binding protein
VKLILDTEPILAFFLDEEGAGKVEGYIELIETGKAKGYLSSVNLSEVYYILYRKSPEIAEDKFEKIIESRIVVVQPDIKIVREAGKIKGKHGIALADAFAVATAIIKKGKLIVASDRDFKQIDEVEIERISGT